MPIIGFVQVKTVNDVSEFFIITGDEKVPLK